MARTPEFIPVETAGGWMVSIPESMSATGERKRKYFQTKTKAEKFAASVRKSHASGIRGAMIPATLALQAVEAERLLEGTGISLVTAAKMAVAASGGDSAKETFGDRYDRATLANEANWSGKYKTQMEAVTRWLPAEFLDRPCGVIDRAAIEGALQVDRPLSQSTLDMRAARILAIVRFRVRHRKTAEISILPHSRCWTVWRVCETAEERRVVAVLLWAGIRPDSEDGEISRLDWSAFGKTEIYIDRFVSKTPSDRHIPITGRLRRLIRGHPKSGPVIPSGWKKRWQRIRRDAGISKLNDVCRHTFASNFLAAFGMEALQSAMGHVAMSQATRRHYIRAITAKDGKRYFR